MLLARKLKGAILLRAEFPGAWLVDAPSSPRLAAALGRNGANAGNFQLPTRVEAIAQLAGGRTLRLTAGKIVMFPHGDAPHPMRGDAARVRADAPTART